jgi:hypothetical protein
MQTIGGVAVGATMLTPKRVAKMASGAVTSGLGRADQIKNHFSPTPDRKKSKSQSKPIFKEKVTPKPSESPSHESRD